MRKTVWREKDGCQGFKLNTDLGYLRNGGVDVMVFEDFYPEGRQSGVSIIMHGHRIAANGDIRFEQTPGQWQPVPKQNGRELDADSDTITASMSFPDLSRHLSGFNPIMYPNFQFNYKVTVRGEGTSVFISVDLDRPIPDRFIGKICFNLELFPETLLGKPWMMDSDCGQFPEQPNGPVLQMQSNYRYVGNFSDPGTKVATLHPYRDNAKYNPVIADDYIAVPYAIGTRLTVCPDDPFRRISFEAETSKLKLYDGRMNHNNGWFVVSSELASGVTKNAVQWVITPNVVDNWLYPPVVQISQVGYHPRQTKTAVIELDKRGVKRENPILCKITEKGEQPVFSSNVQSWGDFLRYNYLKFDFTSVTEDGLYKIRYGSSDSSIFRISEKVYDRGVWQPVFEYFLPIQMCHMRVNEKYRVWHGLCHCDDARMAPVNYNHFDGYEQGSSTLTVHKPGDHVSGLDIGGWHDAGDFDIRIESQSGEIYALSLLYEEFDLYYDATSIDQRTRVTEIHQPDGKNDILQQIEHGVLSLVGAYNALGRLYRGIICGDLRQYVHLGDSAIITDGIKGNEDDRLVFTEDNPPRELTVAAHLAAAARALRGFNDALSTEALNISREIYKLTDVCCSAEKIHAAVELLLTTGEHEFRDCVVSATGFITSKMDDLGWLVCRVEKVVGDNDFTKAVHETLLPLKERYERCCAKTPYNIPYRPRIWGAGWDIQRFACQYYFLHSTYPDIFGSEMIFNALNFILGCHPGSNTASFVSGVGTKSATVAYGINRADRSYVPGGVISGTSLIRPDFPELMTFPYLWQQSEYVMGGTSSRFVFLVLAALKILNVNKT